MLSNLKSLVELNMIFSGITTGAWKERDCYEILQKTLPLSTKQPLPYSRQPLL